MFKYRKKIDEKIAAKIVKYLVKTSVTPNQVTTFSLLLAAFAAVFFSFGIYFFSVIGSILFIFSKFLDHVDGQLARELKKESKFGWYYDSFVDTATYILMFIGISAGIPPGTFEIKFFSIVDLDLQNYLLFSAIIASIFNTLLGIIHRYRTSKDFYGFPETDKVALEDGIYLIGPITWIGLINLFFLAATIGSVVFVIYNLKRFVKTFN
tara:strand:- start:767 stop:1393 length:627 start_codon:yes stop_codon:yes gene_type:complete